MTTIINQYEPDVVFHPGETLGEALEERGMSNKEFALRTGKPEKTISEVIHGKSSITAEMGLLFESVLNIPAGFWLKKQMHYDEYNARIKRQNRIKEAIEWAKQFPYAAMAKLGWVPATRKIEEKVIALFDYFDIAHHASWHEVYMDTRLKLNYRMSLKGSKSPHALSAWLVQGENLAKKISTVPFSPSKVRKALPQLKSVMVEEPEDIKHRIEYILSDCGIKFTFTPCIPKAPVNGVSRWINNQPIIQLSDRWKRYDIFWFTLFHEIGHILIHDKKFMSIENIHYDEKDQKKEEEADEFAIKWTFTHEEEEQFLHQNKEINRGAIVQYAKTINTHPSIIAGRLTKKAIITHSKAYQMDLLNKIDLI